MSNISKAMRAYVSLFNTSETRRTSDEVKLVGLIGQVGNAEEVARQVRLYLPEFQGDKTQKQTFKRSVSLHFRTRFPGYGLTIKLNHCKVVELGSNQVVNEKGKVVKATTPDNSTPNNSTSDNSTPNNSTSDNSTPDSVTLKKSDVETLKRQLTDLKAENKRIKTDSQAEIKSLQQQVAGLTKHNTRLKKETTATEAVYQRIKVAILKTNNKTLKTMVG